VLLLPSRIERSCLFEHGKEKGMPFVNVEVIEGVFDKGPAAGTAGS
jgi:hypothetical protein